MAVARKKPYEAPRIELLSTLGTQKHRTLDIATAEAEMVDVGDVGALLAEFGSPLFVASEQALRAQYRAFRDTFTAPGADTVVAYSYKTNYLPAVCAILHQEGAWAEVVSGVEYELARSLGVPGEHIIFNGPYKRLEELERAVVEGAQIYLDGFDELDALAALTQRMRRTAHVGLRVNFQHGRQSWTKFGFNADNGDAVEALRRVRKAGARMELRGLHNHSGTFQIDPEIYARATQTLCAVARKARELGMAPTMIDLGGGYPSHNRLKQAFEPSDGSYVPGQHLAPFAEAIVGALGRSRKAFGERPTLVLEPGRAVVDGAMRLACSVVARKRIAGQGDAVIVDAGVNLLPTAYWYDHRVDAVGVEDAGAAGTAPVAIYGPLCMQIDILRERTILPPMAIGAPLVVSNVGAYCLTQSMQFIQPRPAVVLVDAKGKAELIRRRETMQDIFALDRVPARLQPRAGKR